MSPPNEKDPPKDPGNQEPEDNRGDVPRPPAVLAAALAGGAIGGFIGAVVGSMVNGGG